MNSNALRALIVTLACGSWARADIAWEVATVGEHRHMVLEGEGKSAEPSIRINFRLQSPALQNVQQAGRWKIEQAVDDQGTNLTLIASPFMENMHNVTEKRFNKANNTLHMMVALKAPARKATRIDVLKGSATFFLGGGKKEASFQKLRELAGKKLEHEVLKAGGLDVTVKEVKDLIGMDTKVMGYSVGLEIGGDTDRLVDVQIADEQGQKLVGISQLVTDANGAVTKLLNLRGDYRETQSLKFTVMTEQKTIVIPFDLENIPLP